MIRVLTGWSLLFLVLMAGVHAGASSLPYGDYWQRGNQQYKNRNYDSAAFYFSQLAATNPDAAEVYYNLGNAHYRLNNIAQAVLYYSKALHLKPGYKQAADNLELTQSRIKNRIPQPADIFFVKWWKAVADPAASGGWAIASLVLFLLLLSLIYWRRVHRSIPSQWITALAVLLLLSVAVAYISAEVAINHDAAVVMQEGAMFRSDNTGKTVQAQIPEGTIITLESQDTAAWVKVSLPDGRTGSMQREALEKI